MTLKNFPLMLLFVEPDPTNPDPDPELELAPGDVKDHPYVIRQRKELAALRQKDKDRVAADAQAEKDKLKADNELTKLNAKLQKELDDARAEFEENLSKRDLRVVNSEIKAVAREAGARNEVLARITKFIDFDKVELDDDGEVTGLQDQIDKLKEEMPFLFENESEPTPTPTTAPARPRRTTTSPAARENYADATKHDRASVDRGWKSLATK